MYEGQALHTLDPTIPDDDWPCLELKDVTVWVRNLGTPDEPIDLLDVGEFGPFRLKGTLQKIPRKLKQIEKSPHLYKGELIVPKVYTYSIDRLEDGSLKLWLLGQAAWYGISPDKTYKDFYDRAMQKAQLWTFLEDIYLESFEEGKPIQGTVDELYEAYWKEDYCSNLLLAQTLFRRHHRFIILKMLENEQMREMWMLTPLYFWYSSKYKEEIMDIRRVLERQKKKHEADRLKGIQYETDEEESRSVTASASKSKAKRKGAKKMDSPATPASKIKSETPIKNEGFTVHRGSPAFTIFNALENHVCQMKPLQVTLKTLARIFWQRYELDSVETALDILALRAQELSHLMTQSERYAWCNRAACKELQKIPMPQNAKQLATIKIRRRRSVLSSPSSDSDLPSIKIKEEAQVDTVFVKQPPLPPQVRQPLEPQGKSQLQSQSQKRSRLHFAHRQPSSSTPQVKPESRLTRIKHEPIDDDYVMSDILVAPPPHTPASTATPRNQRTISRSTTGAEDDEENSAPRSRLRPVNRSDIPIDLTPSMPTAEMCKETKERLAALKRKMDDSIQTNGGGAQMKRARIEQLKSPTPSEASSFSSPPASLSPIPGGPPIRAIPMPQTFGDDKGIWRCTHCRHIIVDAHTSEGIALVEDHNMEHARILRGAMDAIGVETRPRTGHRVDKLLAMIEDKAAKWMKEQEATVDTTQRELDQQLLQIEAKEAVAA